MAETVKLSIPASVAAFVRPGTPLEERLRGAGGAVDLSPREQLLLLFCLSKDSQPEVRSLAAGTLAALDQNLVVSALEGGGFHPAVLHFIAGSCGSDPAVRAVLLATVELAQVTRDLLLTHSSVDTDLKKAADLPAQVAEEGTSDLGAEELDPEAETSESDYEVEATDEDEEYLSKYQLAMEMGISEKIKMALTGDKEWRKILIKDANKLVSAGVIKNPRMSEPEVLTLLKSGVQNDEIMRLICANKEWVKNYQIRKALIENPKTPLANALRYLGTMNEKDVASYAKSRNISSVVSTQAKRMIMNKKH
ncbi:hypothetical protein SAMN02745119_02826 [Trichlorobacter thiogenes]|uniref:Uncharacterized protein n=1 Tax=Trichlorobacter thiogenes TaxID=115783 RepID=A0A1T4RDK0_9BACT|nr:hypothetical protein [Trichlorobacter thiogenes]SKA14104.1 hypothetical protein SAMN02745119_02826 [Trichlorobacter thiogenes]